MDSYKAKLMDSLEKIAGESLKYPLGSETRKKYDKQINNMLLKLDQAKNNKKKGNLKIT